MKNWLVSYTPVAEGVANASLNGPIERQEGEILTLNVSFKNSSTVPFRDSVVVQQTLFGSSGIPQMVERTVGRLAPNQEIAYNITVPTAGRAGENRLLVNFNPRRQPEQNYTNNVLNLPFTVIPDRLPPLLDVVFDGQHIKDGEIVSASPQITMLIKDENRYLFKKDTLGMDIYLQRPNQASFQRIAFSNSLLQFTAANAQNEAKIVYQPNTLPDGLYTLRVQGADASNNRTGVYEITFRVINEQRVIAVEANPNPFNEWLKIVFTVSGKEAPTETAIFITDIAGRILKETTIQPRVGVNEWVWTNTATLPAGAYFYSVSIKKNGQNLPVAEGVKTTGKLVLLK
ncbi:MAG: hypothetical protein R2822_22780 [Spirosomataceae bacterium]